MRKATRMAAAARRRRTISSCTAMFRSRPAILPFRFDPDALPGERIRGDALGELATSLW